MIKLAAINKIKQMDREQFLKQLKLHWIENEIPNITETNAKFLRDLIKIQNTKTMLEIWTANWYSSINFWIELEKTWGSLLTIEFSSKSLGDARKNISQVWLDSVIETIEWNALDQIPKLKDNYFDFVFIDWMKRRSKDFLELSWNKAKLGSIIIIDDVIKFKDKMSSLWLFLEAKKIDYNILPIDLDDWILMIIKNKWNL